MPPQDPNADGGGKPNADGDAKFVTQEQLSQVVNQAVSSHMKRLDTKIGATMKDAVAEALKDMVQKAKDDDDPPGADPPAGGGKGADDKPNPAMTALKRQVETLTTKLQKAEDDRAGEAKQRQRDGLKSAVLKQLGESGLSGQHLRGAQAILYQDDRVRIGDDGAHLFRNAEGEDLPLVEGVKEWIGSDDAKLFLPPKDVRGSGDRGSDNAALPKTKDSAMNQALADAIEGVKKQRLNQQ